MKLDKPTTDKIYSVTQRTRRGTRTFFVSFTHVERATGHAAKREPNAWYCCWTNAGGPDGNNAGAHGTMTLYSDTDEKPEWGIVNWHWTGHYVKPPARRWQPRPGNRHYDLMC